MPCPRIALPVLALALLAGCFSWHNSPSEPAALLGSRNSPNHVRLLLEGGKRTELWDPRIENDSLVGRTKSSPKAASHAYALADVTRVEVLHFSAGKTIGLVAGVGAATLAVAAIALASSDFGIGGGGGGGGGDGGYASCPQVYSWDGARWRLDSGTFGGAFMQPLELTDFDNLDYLVPDHGVLRLRVGNELDETEFVDALTVLAVDHPAGQSIVPTRDGAALGLTTLQPPVAARDAAGRDALAQVERVDDRSWESTLRRRDPGDAADLRDWLELTFVRQPGATHATLVLDGHNTAWASLLLQRFVAAHGSGTAAWYDSLAAAPETARRMAAGLAREGFLSVAVQSGNRWTSQGIFWEAGPEISKRQALVLDLRAIEGDTVRIRLESIPSFWRVDQVAVAWGDPERLTPRPLQLRSAFDRLGRVVTPQLAGADGDRLTLETNDWAELRYQDGAAPIPGMVRSYLLRSTGWYRIHTPASGAVDSVMLAEVGSGPGGVSRVAVRSLNEALRWLTPRSAGAGGTR